MPSARPSPPDRSVAGALDGHPEIELVVAPNPGPMTLAGTNTWVVGAPGGDGAWVIDPGPADAAHIDAIRAFADGRGGIAGVVLTHSHADHSAGVEPLGAGLQWGQISSGAEFESVAAAPADSPPERIGPFAAIPTPGHAADHVAFVATEAGVCFCGDLILGEGSSIVPPAAYGGSLADYMRSLDRVEALGAGVLAPGHGPAIGDPAAKISEYRSHRLDRERRLLAALDRGERSRQAILAEVWDDVPQALRVAAALAMQAHLEKLEAEKRLPEGAEGLQD